MKFFYDRVEVANGSQKNINCSISFSLETAFEDIFEVRGTKREKRGKMEPCQVMGISLSFLTRVWMD